MTKRERELIRQAIHGKRGAYERARRKWFLYLKHTGKLDEYYSRKQLRQQGPRLKPIPANQVPWWIRFKFFLLRLFRCRKHFVTSVKKK